MVRRTEEWLHAHKDYPHKDWCLVWPFAREGRVGRGMLGDPTGVLKTRWAHRVMCEMVHGAAPSPGHQAAHSCGNGHLGCVNPRHLTWETNSQNQLQRYAQGRGNPNANGNQSSFTPTEIAEMRSLYGQMTQMEIAARFGCSLGTVQYYLKYREQRGHTGTKINHWSPEEDRQLQEAMAGGATAEQVAVTLGRTVGGTYGRARRLGFTGPRFRNNVSHPNGER